MAESVGKAAAAEQPQAAEARRPSQPPPIEVDDTQAVTSYTNFCRVTGIPEELIIEYGLNAQLAGMPTLPIRINQRLVMNFFTAKRLLGALRMSVDRHEATFGVLETNIQKRVQSQPR